MLILVAAIPLLVVLSSTGLLVESVPADDLRRMGVAI